MILGVSKHVVIVQAPDDEIFEQAIFILNENKPSSTLDNNDVLKLACNIANQYIKTGKSYSGKKQTNIKGYILPFISGASSILILWILTIILNVNF